MPESTPHSERKTWFCKIGEVDPGDVPDGGDFPMRRFVEDAYQRVTGHMPEFIFSGWGYKLSEDERAVVENRDPAPHDDKGFSEEKCVRCGWVMGSPPLNCQNDDTPHRFPSQGGLVEQLEAVTQARDMNNRLFNEAKSRQHQLEEQLEAAKEDRDRCGRMLLDVEGSLLAYWTDIPETEIERLRVTIRHVLDTLPSLEADLAAANSNPASEPEGT